jgi:hypothetical protein
VFAFVASALAGYGAIRLVQIIFIEGSFKPLIDERSRGLEIIGLVVFFAVLSLMIKGIDAIQKDRFKKEIERRLGDDQRLN